MKLICLNTWGGKRLKPLIDFIKKFAQTTDIFCFQEVFDSARGETLRSGSISNLYNTTQEAIPEFRSCFSASECGHDFDGLPISEDINWGLAVFFKPFLTIGASENFFVHETQSGNVESWFDRPRILQHVELTRPSGEVVHLFNLHGLLDEGAKRDTPLRDAQFAAVREIVSRYGGKKIFCGDFNIRPDTKNIALLGDEMINLIERYGVLKTRNELYEGLRRYNDTISDYVFVSPDISVKSFKVLDVEVSDHLPLVLEFE